MLNALDDIVSADHQLALGGYPGSVYRGVELDRQPLPVDALDPTPQIGHLTQLHHVARFDLSWPRQQEHVDGGGRAAGLGRIAYLVVGECRSCLLLCQLDLAGPLDDSVERVAERLVPGRSLRRGRWGGLLLPGMEGGCVWHSAADGNAVEQRTVDPTAWCQANPAAG
ncbi:hypothetical protein [Micromonospora sp. NPDC093277]|uniref:hypothetical protein n=1 Tax=Micromonospora sp. NPDC093277 TaxID=3364291 RepID=UPI00382435E7